MSRRKKSTPLEGAMDLVALLPWWVGLLMALISYVVLHAIASSSPATFKSGEASGFFVATLVRGIAMAGQFIVPLVCVVGAVVSVLRRRARQALVANVAQSASADSMNNMSWAEFELLVGEAFRLQGYKVIEMGGAGPDGGVDLVLVKGAEKFLVQCKQWKAFKVSVTVVRELYGVMAASGAAGGFVVTSGRFTEDAIAFASGRNIKLIDGPVLHGLIRQAKNAHAGSPAVPRQSSAHVAPAASGRVFAAAPLNLQSTAPSCPSCGALMIKRRAKRGAAVGNEFWGCTTYPACKGTRSL